MIVVVYCWHVSPEDIEPVVDLKIYPIRDGRDVEVPTFALCYCGCLLGRTEWCLSSLENVVGCWSLSIFNHRRSLWKSGCERGEIKYGSDKSWRHDEEHIGDLRSIEGQCR